MPKTAYIDIRYNPAHPQPWSGTVETIDQVLNKRIVICATGQYETASEARRAALELAADHKIITIK